MARSWSTLRTINHVVDFLINLLPTLGAVVFYTLAERKVMASVQRRLGPGYITKFGILQPLADGLKALLKESVVPRRAERTFFNLAPALSFFLSTTAWAFVPFSANDSGSDSSFALLCLFAISSLNVYGVLLSGWASNSRYALIGSIRSVAQMLSYEISLSFTILPVVLFTGSFNFFDIVSFQQNVIWFVVPFWPLAVIFFISSLAETNRAPFDLPEAEAELVAGYNVEYSGFQFALFFLAEYSNMLWMSALNVLLFWGGWDSFGLLPEPIAMVFKTTAFAVLFIIVRAALPRLRFDQLMAIGWRQFLPFTLTYLALLLLYLCSFINIYF